MSFWPNVCDKRELGIVTTQKNPDTHTHTHTRTHRAAMKQLAMAAKVRACVCVIAHLLDAEDAGLQEQMMLHMTDSRNSPDGQNIFSPNPKHRGPAKERAGGRRPRW